MNNRGFALIVTLIVTALMVAAATEMIHQVYVDTSLSRGFRDGQQASLLAESGAVGGAKVLMFWLSGRDVSSLNEKWAAPIKLEDDTGLVEIEVTEESGKIPLNNLVQVNGTYDDFVLASLRRLGRRIQIPDDCWGALADWIDSDELPRSGGAESAYYKNLKPAYSAHNGPLTTGTELSLVKGFTPEMVSSLQPFVTIYADQPGAPLSRININTASKEVLMALDDRIDQRMAEKILEERRLKPFTSPGDLSRVDSQLASVLAARISVKGSVFRVTARSRVRDAGRTAEAVIRLGGSQPEYLSWQEY